MSLRLHEGGAGEVLPQVVKGAASANFKREETTPHPSRAIRGTSPLEEEAAGDDEVAGSSPAPPTTKSRIYEGVSQTLPA
jgi:hypothetical protein